MGLRFGFREWAELLQLEQNYKDDKKDGLTTEWHENGLKYEDNYKNGKLRRAEDYIRERAEALGRKLEGR